MSRPSPQTERLIALVDLLSERPTEGLTLADISRGLGVGKATIHPMLTALTRAGWLLRHPARRTYRLGPALVAAGRAAATGDTALDLARPVMRELSAAAGMGCIALVPGGTPGEGDDLRIGEVVRVPGRPVGEVGMRLGDRIRPRPPLAAVTVAWGGERAFEAWLSRLNPEERASARESLAPALAAIRRRGWAVEVEDRLRERLADLLVDIESELGAAEHALALRQAMAEVGRIFDFADALPTLIDPHATYRVSSVNAPVFDPDGAVVVVLCLVDNFDRSGGLTGNQVLALGARVRDAAAEVTRMLRGRVPAV